MIISGYERPVEYGRLLIFDPTMAQMVLLSLKQYNDALKDEYERGLKQMDDFYKTFGDFISPFEEDMKRYGQMIGGIRGALDEAYANNINLLGSPEGRMMISRLTNAIDPSEFNIMRTNAKLGFEYLKNIEEAKAEDQFSQEFEDYLLTHGGPGLFKDFSSKKGMWNRPGPGRYLTVDELIEPIVKNVDYTLDEDMTKAHNDGHDYYSITRDRLMKAIDDNMGDILATLSGGFHYWKAMLAAKALGGDEEMGKQIFRTMIGNRLSDHEKIKKEVNQFKLNDHRTANDINAAWAKEAARSYYDILPYADENGDGKLSSKERKKYAASTIGGGNNRRVPNIFREAEALTQDLKGNPGQLVLYELPEQYHQYIDPVVQADQRLLKDKDSGDTRIGYVYSSEGIGKYGAMWVLGQDGKFHHAQIKNPSKGQYLFIPGGSMRSLYVGIDKNGNKSYRYFISGQFRTPHGHFIHNDDGTDTQWVEVKERAYNYGQTLKKQ